MASKIQKMSKQGSAGKRKHLTIIPQKFEIGSDISWRDVVDSHNMGLSSICDVKKQKDQICSFVESSEIVKDIFKWQTWTEPKLMHLDKASYKWFTAMCYWNENVWRGL
jgi:hypothetical protein